MRLSLLALAASLLVVGAGPVAAQAAAPRQPARVHRNFDRQTALRDRRDASWHRHLHRRDARHFGRGDLRQYRFDRQKMHQDQRQDRIGRRTFRRQWRMVI